MSNFRSPENEICSMNQRQISWIHFLKCWNSKQLLICEVWKSWKTPSAGLKLQQLGNTENSAVCRTLVDMVVDLRGVIINKILLRLPKYGNGCFDKKSLKSSEFKVFFKYRRTFPEILSYLFRILGVEITWLVEVTFYLTKSRNWQDPITDPD